jgi:anti-sigma B factor antagonist
MEGTVMEQRTFHREDGQLAVVVVPSGDLDVATAWQFRLKLQSCIANVTPHVIVNLGQLHAIDSAGMTTLVAGLRDTEKAAGSFRICNLPLPLRPVFEVSMMDNLFTIYDSEDAAVTAWKTD